MSLRVRPERGFSLFELLVVLFIVGVVAAMSAPSVGRFLDGLAFKRKLSSLTAAMRYARMRAVADGAPLSMELVREDGCRFLIHGLKEESRPCYFKDDDQVDFAPPGPLHFRPDGRLRSPVEITVISGERHRQVRVDILTGLPNLSKGGA